MNIFIKTIPHKNQRYSTCGDWFYDKDGTLFIFVSELNDWRYNFLVAVHELIEVFLCRHSGVTQKQVDRFDIQYEKNRKAGDDSEPGDSPKSPYRTQHLAASGIEKVLASMMGVCWADYENAINSLFE